ncbi:MAG: GAF domain-containing protein [Deltaproteobacteria bacterium]|nr:GAF domain-containing protein [Deltaproteobacteria bacterium]
MAALQRWRVSTGTGEVEIEAENWLGALAQGFPALGMDLGAFGRLVCATDADGGAVARDPRTGGEIRVDRVAVNEPPSLSMPTSSFAALYAPQLRAPPPASAPVELESSDDELTPIDAAIPANLPPPVPEVEAQPDHTDETEPPQPPPPAPLDTRLEDLFMELGEIASAPTANDACLVALKIASRHVPTDAGAVLIRTRHGDGLRFRAAMGPAARAVIDTVIPLDKGIAGFAYQLGLALAIDDAKRDSRHYGRVDRATGYTTRGVLAAPVRGDRGGTFGCVELLNPRRPFTADDIEIVSRVGAALGEYMLAGYAT